MLIGNCSTTVFADSEKTNIGNNIIEIGKTYTVALEFYNLYNESVKGKAYVCARNFMDDVAMIQKLNDSEYRVALHIDNIEKFDILQISKPGAISDDIQPKDVKLGTYNIPDSVICTPESNRDKYPDNAADEAMQELTAEGYFSEEWNDKYFQKDELTIEKGSLGSGYVSFITENLESGLYINAFRSYAKTSKSKPYSSCVGRSKIKLLMNNISEIKELTSENYNNAGLEVGRVANTTDINYRSVGDEASINEILELNSIEIENGKVKAIIKTGNGVSNVRIVNEIYDLGEKSAYPTDIQYRKYTNTYPQERSGTKGLAIYSDELLQKDGTFTVEFSGMEEVLCC